MRSPGGVDERRAAGDAWRSAGARRAARQAARDRLRRLEVAQRISAAVNAAGELDDMLRRLLAEVLDVVGAQRGAVLLSDPARRLVRGRVGTNYPAGMVEAVARPLASSPRPDEDIYALVVRTGEQLVISAEHPARHRPNVYGFPAAFRVLTPIRHAGETIGVFSAVWTEREETTEDDLAMLRLMAEQAGGAVARARLLEELGAAQGRLGAALRVSGAVLYSYDAEGRLDAVQGDIQALLGWSEGELLGRSVLEFGGLEDSAEARAWVEARLHGDATTTRYETVLRHRSGRPVPVLILRAPRYVEGALAGGAGALLDLSALRRAQQERAAALALVARAEGAVRTGRAVVHQLASPLGAALGLAELLGGDADLPGHALADVAALREQLLRMGELLHRFGRIARYEETASPAGPQLDLERASRDDGPC